MIPGTTEALWGERNERQEGSASITTTPISPVSPTSVPPWNLWLVKSKTGCTSCHPASNATLSVVIAQNHVKLTGRYLFNISQNDSFRWFSIYYLRNISQVHSGLCLSFSSSTILAEVIPVSTQKTKWWKRSPSFHSYPTPFNVNIKCKYFKAECGTSHSKAHQWWSKAHRALPTS